MSTLKTIQVEFYYILKNCGDGSARALFFRTKEAFDKYAENMDTDGGFAEFCGGALTFPVNAKTGEIVVAPMQFQWAQPFEEDKKDS